MHPSIAHILDRLKQCSRDERHEVYLALRQEFPIHPIEQKLNAPAEVILEAIARSSDLTMRGIRGVIADAAFAQYVVPAIAGLGWQDITPPGNHAYDYLLQDASGAVRVQVKMQRQKNHRPMMANEAYRHLATDMFVVETQRTRGGRDPQTGDDTRPYRFGEFDILAVSMHPSTNQWDRFMFTVGDWLLTAEREDRISKFQPVAQQPNQDWTDDFLEVVRWLRSGVKKRL